MTLDSLKNSNIHTHFIEVIRRKVADMGEIKWKIQLCWVKAHAGIQGNELADTLAKETATNADIIQCTQGILFRHWTKRLVLGRNRLIPLICGRYC